MDDIPSRVAVLEQIARNTETILSEIRSELREVRTEARADFRWLMGVMLGGLASLAGVMAHGFHWI